MGLKNKLFKTTLSVAVFLSIISSLILVFLTNLDLYGSVASVAKVTVEATVEGSRWSGVDEAVVERFAKEHGREAKEPLINTDQGDLLLFVFLIAGAGGGFLAGYYWRRLTEQK
jgi:hypothetical protein